MASHYPEYDSGMYPGFRQKQRLKSKFKDELRIFCGVNQQDEFLEK
jgi:hypothetical protein